MSNRWVALIAFGTLVALPACSGDDSGTTGGSGASGSGSGTGGNASGGSASGGDASGGTGPGAAGGAGGGGGMAMSECTRPTSGPTTHMGGAVTSDEVWTADASPHVVPGDMTITAQLTLEPCAIVEIAGYGTITASSGGSIVANGTATQRVTIRRKDPEVAWASMRAIGGTLSLSYTDLIGGGEPLNLVPDAQAVLDVRGDQYSPPQEILHADHVTIEGSSTQGIYLREGGGFSATSDAVVITGSAGAPVHTWATLAGTIPSGDYTGNTRDEIMISGIGLNEAIVHDVTFHNRGVPYYVGQTGSFGTLYVGSQSGPLATLTIEPGVTLRFKKGGALYVHYFAGDGPAFGALVAQGGSDATRIVFTSAEPSPAPGDWLGLRYGATPDPTNKLDFVAVEYAGQTPSGAGSSSCLYPSIPINDAAIRMIGPGAPSASFVTNTIVAHSASHGIDRGFKSDAKPDFLPTNTFTDVAFCDQTWPGPVNAQSPQCPDPPPCPSQE